jgi:hypothetical protein
LTPDRKEADHANGNSNEEREYIAEEEARVCRNERRDYYTVTLKHTDVCRTTRGQWKICVDKGRPRGENHLPLYILDILDLLVYKYKPSSHFISRLP